MSELLNCPFCDGTDILTTVRRPAVTYCGSCDAVGPEAASPTLSMAAWNRRATPSPWRPNREAIARIIDPIWFNMIGDRHALDNYPGQHKKYQADALAKADAILALDQHQKRADEG